MTFTVDIVIAKDKKVRDVNEVISDAIESNLGGQNFRSQGRRSSDLSQ